MLYLADTNILLRSCQPAHPMQAEAANAIQLLLQRSDQVCIISQNLIEFWNAATRPAVYNGLGLTIQQAEAELQRWQSFLRLLPDNQAIFTEWERLVVQHSVVGKNVYDARIAAAMNVYGIRHLLTFNGGDFKRYSTIAIVSPGEVK